MQSHVHVIAEGADGAVGHGDVPTHGVSAAEVVARLAVVGNVSRGDLGGKAYIRICRPKVVFETRDGGTVADVFDALVSDRPYRGAWNPRKAMDYIAGGSGITFDPVVTSAFHELLKRGSPDLWQAYPALESQLARDAGFARSRGPRPSVFVS